MVSTEWTSRSCGESFRQKPFLALVDNVDQEPLKRAFTRLVDATCRAKSKQKMLAKWPDLLVIIGKWASHYNWGIYQDLRIFLPCIQMTKRQDFLSVFEIRLRHCRQRENLCNVAGERRGESSQFQCIYPMTIKCRKPKKAEHANFPQVEEPLIANKGIFKKHHREMSLDIWAR